MQKSEACQTCVFKRRRSLQGSRARRLDPKYDIHGYRTTNLLICSGGTFNYLTPYMVPLVLASSMTQIDIPGAVAVSAVDITRHQFYPICLLIMTLCAVTAGFGHTFLSDTCAEYTKKTTLITFSIMGRFLYNYSFFQSFQKIFLRVLLRLFQNQFQKMMQRLPHFFSRSHSGFYQVISRNSKHF